MSSPDILRTILEQRPKLHGSPENPRDQGIKGDVARFIYQTVKMGDVSLETGCGISTLVFAVKGSTHTAVTPTESEIKATSEYASSNHISLDTIRFVNERSESYLPRAVNEGQLDFVFIDGCHAFPWPAMDYFYTAHRVMIGGTILVDDILIPSVKMLADFLSNDANWKMSMTFPRRAIAYSKVGDNLDVEWMRQRYNSGYLRSIQKKSVVRRAVRKSKRVLGGLLGEKS